MIRSIFKTSMQNYKIYPQEEVTKLNIHIIALFAKYKAILLDTLKKESMSNEFATLQQLKDSISLMNNDTAFTPRVIDYIITKLMKTSTSVN